MTLCFMWLDSSEILDGEIGDASFKHLSEHDDIAGTMSSHSHKDLGLVESLSRWFHKGTNKEHHNKPEPLNAAAVAYLRQEIEEIIMQALMCISLLNDKYIVDSNSLHSYCGASTSAGHKSEDDVLSNVAEAGSDRDTNLDSDDEDDKVKGMHHIGHSKSFWNSDDGFPSYKFCGVESISIATDTEFDSFENEEVADEQGITIPEEPSLIFGDASDELDLDD